MVKNKPPSRGDIVWLNFDPQKGHEQAGKRPALVLSPKSYNQKVGLALLVPITNQKKGYAFEVEIPDGLDIEGVILCDQIKSLDWKARNSEIVDQVSDEVLKEVLAKVRPLLE